MRPMSLAEQAQFERFAKKTRREQFLEEMDAVMPWAELLSLVEPHYPKGEKGRKPVGLELMLRIYFLQHWFNLSDPAAEEALYDSLSQRRFAGIDLGTAAAPDETRSSTSATCLSSTNSAARGWTQSTTIWRAAASASRPAPSWMRPSSPRLRRPRTRRRNAIPRCTRRAKATHGTSA